jgi:allantoinase
MKSSHYGPVPYSPIIDRPRLQWPNRERVAVWVIPNIEFYPLTGLMTNENAIVPNVPAWSRRDYGNRVGVFRLMETMADRKIRGTVALNSDVCAEHPRIIGAASELGWEMIGHCQNNTQPLHKLHPDQEKNAIALTLQQIKESTGTRPRGWLGAGLNETWNTLDYLSSEGVRYVADWVNDDQPYLMNVGNPSMVSIPYSLELNDITAIAFNHLTADEFGDTIRRQFSVLYEEGGKSARVMAIALHPYIIGVPHRIKALASALDFIAAHEDVWFATGTEIVDAYLQHAGRQISLTSNRSQRHPGSAL